MAQDKQATSQMNDFGEALGIGYYTLRDIPKYLQLCFADHTVACLVAESATGKTQVMQQITQKLGMNLVVMYLSHKQPEDFGIPFPNAEGTSYKYLCEESILQVIQSGEPTVIFLDEWNRAEKSVMNAAFTMMEKPRRFGSHVLPDNIYVVAAMNPSEGNYLVNDAEKDPAFRRRMNFVGVVTDTGVWLNYAINEGKFHKAVTGFISASPQSLVDVAAREAGKVYANPAAWEKISNTLYAMEALKFGKEEFETALRMKVSGHIGYAMTERFMAYLEDNASMINPEEVVKSYPTVAERIERLVATGRNDKIAEMCDGIAMYLVSMELLDETTVSNVGKFILATPDDVKVGFITKLTRHAKNADRLVYQNKLSSLLMEIPEVREELGKAVGRTRAADAEAKLS